MRHARGSDLSAAPRTEYDRSWLDRMDKTWRLPLAAVDVIAVICGAGLLAVWVLYPVAMGLLAAARPPTEVPSLVDWPHVSIVVATREPEAAVQIRIHNLLETDYPADRIEIVVAWDRAVRRPSIAVPEDVRLRTVPGDEPGGKAASLNAAMRAVTSEFVVFADTYQMYNGQTIPNLIAALHRRGVGAVTGGYEVASGTGKAVALYWSYERWLRRAEARVHSSVGATGAVYALNRALWKPLPPGLILDDVYTPMKVVLSGLRVAVADDALALETRTPTPRQEYGRKVRTLTGVMQLCAWLPTVLIPVHNPIWAQFMFHKVLRLLTPYFVLGVGVWTMVRIATWMTPFTLAALTVIGAGCALWLAMSRGRAGTRLRRMLVDAVLIQVAVIVAGFNGLRGQWQVWDA